MPPCKHGKLCKIKNCPLKHVDEQEVQECIFFKQGFCYNGPHCIRRHLKRLPDEVPIEASFEQCITGGSASAPKRLKAPNENYKVSLCNHWLLKGTCHFNEGCHFAHGEEEIHDSPQSEPFQDSEVYDLTRDRMDAPLELPFPEARVSYFLFQSPDLRSLMISKLRGVWSVPTRLAAEINTALRTHDHVIAYMCVRSLKGIYGVIKIVDGIPAPPPHLTNFPMTPEFRISWLRTMRVSLRTVAQLKIGTTGMFVGRTTSDSKFESKVGSELLYISYRKPVWDWSEEGELQLAEMYLVRQRALNGEAVPVIAPDCLFSAEWIEKASIGISDAVKSSKLVMPVTPVDFYTLPHPGIMVLASGAVADEMFNRLVNFMQSFIFYTGPSMRKIQCIYQYLVCLQHEHVISRNLLTRILTHVTSPLYGPLFPFHHHYTHAHSHTDRFSDSLLICRFVLNINSYYVLYSSLHVLSCVYSIPACIAVANGGCWRPYLHA